MMEYILLYLSLKIIIMNTFAINSSEINYRYENLRRTKTKNYKGKE